MYRHQSPKIQRKKTHSYSIFTPNTSLYKLREFLDEVEKMKGKSRYSKNNYKHTQPRSSLIARNIKINKNIPYRNATKPLPEITFQDLHNPDQKRHSQSQKKQFEKPCTKSKQQYLKQRSKIINNTSCHSNINTIQSVDYYKRFLLPVQKRIIIQSPDTYLTISRVEAHDVQTVKTPKTRLSKRVGSLNSARASMTPYRHKRVSSQITSLFGKCDTPWEYQLNINNEF